ncbi:MAG: hypothetical protein H0W23_06660 [Chloroflexia bacterium]|nr:hypothetical protein [Chloroflexia bacterium]
MIEIPPAFAGRLIAREGAAGRTWIASLPALVGQICAGWGLEIDGAPMAETVAIVIPVRRGDDRAALKLGFPTALNGQEVIGLRAWDGRGVVKLLDVDPGRSALLLEWLDAARPLSMVPLMASADIAGRLIRRLAVPVPCGAPLEVQVLADRASTLVATLSERWERAGRPFPESLLSRAIGIAVEIGPRAAETLANWDLHHGNVLAGTREPWLVIDPMIVAGDPEVSVFPMVVRRLDEMAGPAVLREFLARVVAAGGLDPELTTAWLRVRAVDYWLWALGIGLTEDPVRCARLVDWLGPE